ncbi:MAG: hypothetical protein AB7W16_15255 [Candidatus Obscuribacterales bacterium]
MKDRKAKSPGIGKRSFLAVLLALAVCHPAAASGEKEIDTSKHLSEVEALVKGQEWRDGTGFLGAVYRNVLSLDDYQFDSVLKCFEKKLQEEEARFFFKKAKRLRCEVLSGGLHKGSVVVRRQDGVIKGSGGGGLRFLKMTLAENSRLLRLPNGYNVVHSDFNSLLCDLKDRIARGENCVVTKKSIESNRFEGPIKVMEVKDPSGNLTDRIFVSESAKVPVEWDVFKEGNLLSIVQFDNFKANPGLSDSLFNL